MTWSCGECTFDNERNRTQCEICGTEQGRWECKGCALKNGYLDTFCGNCKVKRPIPPPPPRRSPEQVSRAPVQAPQTPVCASPPVPELKQWECRGCTFLNNLSMGICEICFMEAPSSVFDAAYALTYPDWDPEEKNDQEPDEPKWKPDEPKRKPDEPKRKPDEPKWKPDEPDEPKKVHPDNPEMVSASELLNEARYFFDKNKTIPENSKKFMKAQKLFDEGFRNPSNSDYWFIRTREKLTKAMAEVKATATAASIKKP